MADKRGGWRGELGRLEGRAAQDTLGDQVALVRLIFRIPLLPFRLLIWARRRAKDKREMLAFARARVEFGPPDPKALAVEWLKAHPDEYPFGEYDPRRPRLEAAFSKMVPPPPGGAAH